MAQKTKLISAIKRTVQTTAPTSSGWKIASYASGLVLVALVAFYLIGRRNFNADISRLEKSVAVLPFINDNLDDTNQYFINGVMEEVLHNLQKIKDLRVLSRISTDHYKGKDRPTLPEIAEILDVNYIVEGNAQKIGNTFRLRVKLIRAQGKETQSWAKSIKKEIKEVEDYTKITSKTALEIAAELKAVVTSEEKQNIKKVPTTNRAAMDLYLKANNHMMEYEETNDFGFYQKAVDCYKAALLMDPFFAKAYTGLAGTYFNRQQGANCFNDNYRDSILALIDKALDIDYQLDEAYYFKGKYYYAGNQIDAALENFDKALKINPNFFQVYAEKGYILAFLNRDYISGINNYRKALNLIQGKERSIILHYLADAYLDVGFAEKARYYIEEAFALDSNRISYLTRLARVEFNLGNFEENLKLIKAVFGSDSKYLPSIKYYFCLPSKYNEEAFLVAKSTVEEDKKFNLQDRYFYHRIGYIFWQMGKQEEAEIYFHQKINYTEELIKNNYDLAATYAFLGDKEKAYKFLEEFNTVSFHPLSDIILAKHDPLFESIRNELRFQKILQNMIAKYQTEHDRVGKWIEEQGMPEEGF